jgi:hypothetical protein
VEKKSSSRKVERAAFESETAAIRLDGLPLERRREPISLENLDEDGDEVKLLEIEKIQQRKATTSSMH